MKIKGKIGYCDNRDLRQLQSNTGGHYVYIRRVRQNGVCDVSTCTSLEDNRENIKIEKMKQVRNGKIYPIPKKDSNFQKWTGINKNTMRVHKSKIRQIGKKKFKRKHYFPIGK